MKKSKAKAKTKVKAKVKLKKTKTKAKAKIKAKAKAKTKAKTKVKTKAKVKAKAKTKSKAKARAKAPVRKKSAVRAANKPVGRIPAVPIEDLAAQEMVESAKYFTGIEERRPPQQASLPYEYGEERITLLVRDPETVFAYWEVPADRLGREQARLGRDARLCVRLYDVTGVHFDGTNATSVLDQEVYERVGSWYFNLDRPAHRFCADIGLRSADGRFATIARSNVAATPPSDVSDVTDEEWMLIEEEFLKLYGLAGALAGGRGLAAGGLSSPQMQELLKQRRLLEITSPGARSRKRAR